VVELYLLFAVVVSIIAFVNGVQEAIEGVMVFGVLLALEKLVTVYHANHFLDEAESGLAKAVFTSVSNRPRADRTIIFHCAS